MIEIAYLLLTLAVTEPKKEIRVYAIQQSSMNVCAIQKGREIYYLKRAAWYGDYRYLTLEDGAEGVVINAKCVTEKEFEELTEETPSE